jgi:acetyl esterase/lipase
MSKFPSLQLKPRLRSRRSIFVIAVVVLAVATALYVEHLPTTERPVRDTARKLYAHTAITLAMVTVAHTQLNVPYCGARNPAQELDLYTPKHPKQAAGPYPLVVFIHGGGWYSGSKDDPIVGTYGPALVRQGFALASINYRLDPRYTYPTQDQDVSCALGFLYHHASTYQIEKSRIGLFGASAGGQLAAYAAIATSSRTQPWYPSIKGVVDFYGVANLVDLPHTAHLSPVVHRFVGREHSHADDVAASPVTYAHLPAPPFLIFHGDLDRRVPLAQSQELARDLSAAGNSATLVVVQHAGHGFGVGDQPSVGQIRAQVVNFFSDALAN